MKLIALYGPPAVGKQTIAEELAKQTGFKLFHGHLTWNAVNPIFPWGTDSFHIVLPEIRRVMMTQAAKADIDLVFSFVYSPSRNHISKSYFECIEDNGGEVCLVHLKASTETMEQCVSEPSRVKMGKIITVKQLRSYHEKMLDLGQPIPERNSLELDTGSLTPEQSAQKIIKHYILTS